MHKLGLVLVVGLSLLPILIASRGRRHTTVFYWGIAALLLWATGLALALGESQPVFLMLAHAAGPVSASLFLIGARHFARRPRIPALPFLGAAGGVVTGLLFFGAGRGSAAAFQIATSFPMLAMSAWVVSDNAWRSRARIPERALGIAIACLALLMPVDSVTRLYVDADSLFLPVWATLAFAISFLTLAAIGDRSARRAWRLTAELQERKDALEVERRTLLTLVETSPVGVVLVAASGQIRYLNARASEVLGIAPPDQWKGGDVAKAAAAIGPRLTSEGREELAAILAKQFSDAEIPPRFDVEVDDGSLILELMTQQVNGEDGTCLGRLWLCQDVTEERRLDERLAQAQRMDTVGTLAGGIAHDFNNQLTAILGNVDHLLLDIPEHDPSRLAVESIEQSALHCAELTQGLLSFAKKRPTSVARVEVAAVVEDVVSLLRPGLPVRAELTTHLAEDVGSILADGHDLQRVLMNLGLNARDAVGPTGHIRIEARRIVSPEGAMVELVVADDGSGMDAATRQRIFEPFFTTKELGKGTGLGLSVVYGIAEAHGATIDVETGPGAGTTFRLLWPASTSSEELPVPVRSPGRPPVPSAGLTVLLGEDEPAVRKATIAMLERGGYRVIAAVDGPDAVARFNEFQTEIDLVLLDIGMPGFSGLEALRQIDLVAPGRPAILMSGNPDPFKEELRPGTEILHKPFRAPQLIERLGQVSGQAPDDSQADG